MTSLVIAETRAGELLPITSRLVRAASKLNRPINLLVIEAREEHVASRTGAELAGVERVIRLTLEKPDRLPLDKLALGIRPLMERHNSLVGADSGFGRHLVPLVAGWMDAAPLTGITRILGNGDFERAIYAGALTEQVRYNPGVLFLTVRAAAFDQADRRDPAPIETVSLEPGSGMGTEIIDMAPRDSSRPELETAETVIAGGRGMGGADGFRQLEQLAGRLQAALGASRVAVDMGWAPHDAQIGQTGRKIAPELYIAFGVSGAAQHAAGIKDARIVVCVNKDENAPMFKLADYGLVGDAQQIAAALLERLEK